MVRVSSHFVQVARNITDRISTLFNAPVFVTDALGMVITSSESTHNSNSLTWNKSTSVRTLRLPIRYKTEAGEVIIGEPLDHVPIPPQIAQVLVELLIDQTANHHTQTISLQDLKDQFIHDLLQGCIQDETVALKYATRFAIDLNPPRAVILISAIPYILGDQTGRIDRSIGESQRRAKAIIRSIVKFFHLPNDTICADLRQGEVCVLKASDTKNLGDWAEGENDKSINLSWANLAALKRATDALLTRLRNETATTIDIGIGRYHPGISGLARSYEDARAALSLGTRFKGHNRVHCLGELGIATFVGVADEQTKVDLAKYLLSPLDHEVELFTTLDVFFLENCCPSSTAKRLSIHRNTLSYRLDKIASLTGLEPRKFDDAVQMRLCLLLRSLQSPGRHG